MFQRKQYPEATSITKSGNDNSRGYQQNYLYRETKGEKLKYAKNMIEECKEARMLNSSGV